jgi:N-hydroxyarylamine O-acetyltransferase
MSNESGIIDAYCARIDYAGPREPTLAVLQAIVAAHSTAIPFENLDVLLKRPIRLDPPSLYAKLVHGRRGGYCFEHNLLLLDILLTLGFHAQGLAARVRWGRLPEVIGPRTHMLLRVDLPAGPHIADVGFGGLTPTAPLALAAGREQPTPHETFRLAAAGAEYDLEARLGSAWSSLYRFSLQAQMAVDYEVANWFTSTHPNSLFVNHLIVSRPGPGRRSTLFNDKFTVRHRDGKAERDALEGADQLAEILSSQFGIAPTNAADVAAVAALVDLRAADAHPDPFEVGSAS